MTGNIWVTVGLIWVIAICLIAGMILLIARIDDRIHCWECDDD